MSAGKKFSRPASLSPCLSAHYLRPPHLRFSFSTGRFAENYAHLCHTHDQHEKTNARTLIGFGHFHFPAPLKNFF
jgi:hypothetical protein